MSKYVTCESFGRLCNELDLRKAVFDVLVNKGEEEMNFSRSPDELLKLVMKRTHGRLDPTVAKTYIEGLYQ